VLKSFHSSSGYVAIYLVMVVVAASATAQAKKIGLVRVYIGADGLAHVVDSTGADVGMPKERGQAAVSRAKLAADEQTAGWLIEQENCSTSYPIAASLAIYRAGKKRLLLRDRWMIYDWCFVESGKRVAMSTATVHGMTSRHLLLYATTSAHRLRKWNGAMDADASGWASGLKQ
jgi:hypothetical protein